MRRMLYSRVAFIMFKILLSQWRDCSLQKAVEVGVDKGLMCHVSKKSTFFLVFLMIITQVSHSSISAIEMGRSQIVNRLLELGPHRFCPRGVPRSVDYNVVPLSSAIGGGILLTVHGEVVNPHLAGPQMDHILSVDQNFVLRKRELEEDEYEDG